MRMLQFALACLTHHALSSAEVQGNFRKRTRALSKLLLQGMPSYHGLTRQPFNTGTGWDTRPDRNRFMGQFMGPHGEPYAGGGGHHNQPWGPRAGGRNHYDPSQGMRAGDRNYYDQSPAQGGDRNFYQPRAPRAPAGGMGYSAIDPRGASAGASAGGRSYYDAPQAGRASAGGASAYSMAQQALYFPTSSLASVQTEYAMKRQGLDNPEARPSRNRYSNKPQPIDHHMDDMRRYYEQQSGTRGNHWADQSQGGGQFTGPPPGHMDVQFAGLPMGPMY
jgi:hypothetical protein